jgi:hypothetical protein
VPDAEVIAAIARGWTSTPEDCWFCAWDGFGWDSAVEYAAFTATGTPPEIVREPKPDPVPASVRNGPRVRLPNREYLADGRIEALPASPGDPVNRVEAWVAAWVEELADGLLARGEASLTTPYLIRM